MEPFKRLPDAELEVMLLIWQSHDAIHTGELLQRLRKTKDCNLQMLQSTLNRLVSKQFIKCEKIGRLNFYTPLVDAEDYRIQEAGGMIEKLYENSPAKLFAALFKNNALSEGEVMELKKLLEESGE
ncbi:BlaI/MecI/CopY family transcriptional regulator [Oscillospiraceae bacterium LTW-04]|nr:BlaI/MecI/CopY family transcriptional regulator [Oscillospiraceae bacterium MB24-C1]